MAILGRWAQMVVVGRVDFGVYLCAEGDDEQILLPRREVPRGCEVGQRLEVFLYLDSEDRPVATTTAPKIEVGQCALLTVVEVNEVGAFLDWGLPRDLFMPFAEQRWPAMSGESCVVFAYVDNTGRLAASSKLSRHLAEQTDDYEPGDAVELLLCDRGPLGWDVVIDGEVFGLLMSSDALGELVPGQRVKGYVRSLREDGKLDLSLQRPGQEGRDALSAQILAHLEAEGGRSTLTDRSPPEAIFGKFGVSKKAYKKALGGLYRRKKIVIEADCIRLARPPRPRASGL